MDTAATTPMTLHVALETLADVARWGLLVTFFRAAFSKTRDRETFRASVESALGTGRLSTVSGAVAWVVIGLEWTVVVLLLTATWLGALLAATSLAVFSMLIARKIRQGATFMCSCFGERRPATQHDIGRNLLLLAMAAGSASAPALSLASLEDTVAHLLSLSIGTTLASLAINVSAIAMLFETSTTADRMEDLV